MPRFLGFSNSGPREKEPQSGPDLTESTLNSTVQRFRANEISINELEKKVEEDELRSSHSGELQLRSKVSQRIAEIFALVINDKISSNSQSEPDTDLNPDEKLILEAVREGKNYQESRQFFIEHDYSDTDLSRMVMTVTELRKLQGQTTGGELPILGQGSDLYTEGARPGIERLRERNEENKPSQ